MRKFFKFKTMQL